MLPKIDTSSSSYIIGNQFSISMSPSMAVEDDVDTEDGWCITKSTFLHFGKQSLRELANEWDVAQATGSGAKNLKREDGA